MIQLSGVDSYSGTPGAAHVFSENYLYTQQAFELYLSRLSERGILHMMRLEHPTASRDAARGGHRGGRPARLGIGEPAAHIVTLTATRGNITSLLVKRTPFTPEERQRLEDWAGKSPHFHVSASADRNARRENAYEAFLSLGDARARAGLRPDVPVRHLAHRRRSALLLPLLALVARLPRESPHLGHGAGHGDTA